MLIAEEMGAGFPMVENRELVREVVVVDRAACRAEDLLPGLVAWA